MTNHTDIAEVIESVRHAANGPSHVHGDTVVASLPYGVEAGIVVEYDRHSFTAFIGDPKTRRYNPNRWDDRREFRTLGQAESWLSEQVFDFLEEVDLAEAKILRSHRI